MAKLFSTRWATKSACEQPSFFYRYTNAEGEPGSLTRALEKEQGRRVRADALLPLHFARSRQEAMILC